CGETSPKWMGQCPNCGNWNTMVETVVEKPSGKTGRNALGGQQKPLDPQAVVQFGDVDQKALPQDRLSTGIGEFDRVLGITTSRGKQTGGIVPGAVILIGGEPGIGKSTLLTQMVIEMAEQSPQILYVAGEESPSQITLRINRILQIEDKNKSDKNAQEKQKILSSRLKFLTTTDVDQLITYIEQQKPSIVIVDSIQSLTTDDLSGAAGSVGQLREGTDRLTQIAKRFHIPIFLVGHVTKEGEIAGPKVLEHIVDAVLELSGERTGQLRLLRAIKNRFGATDEVGIFQVNDVGLSEVINPSQIFLGEHDRQAVGSAIACVMEGTRPLLVEVQALVVDSQLAMPRRVGRGVQLSRLQVLAAVLQKHARLPLGSTDIFVNIAGGFTVQEPAIDLALCVAIASSYKNISLPEKSVFIGEVGLLGEIRQVGYADRRIKECKRLGYTSIFTKQSAPSVAALLKQLKLS
ncbi:DNA repair protein RadA, partial [Patescibacteria group bacterium]|nr:DNA repair protein RadA [Patescibacteria group bacterium]